MYAHQGTPCNQCTYCMQAAAKEDRRLWQQRLQRLEHELQANKLHIQALMQQLHAIASKQALAPDAGTPVTPHHSAASSQQHAEEDGTPPSHTSAIAAEPSSPTGSCGSSSESSTTYMQANSSSFFTAAGSPAASVAGHSSRVTSTSAGMPQQAAAQMACRQGHASATCRGGAMLHAVHQSHFVLWPPSRARLWSMPAWHNMCSVA